MLEKGVLWIDCMFDFRKERIDFLYFVSIYLCYLYKHST